MRTRNLLLFTGLSALVLTFAACGDDDETAPPTSTGTTTSTSGTGGSGAGGNGTGGDTTSTGGNGGENVGGNGGNGGAGGGEQPIHGCTSATAEDLTGMATVTITDDGNDWANGHNRCIRIDAGTTVIWNGNFNTHPLRGGIQPNPDNTNPVEDATAVGMVTTVVFASAGDFPYFCEFHSDMNGVVYVE